MLEHPSTPNIIEPKRTSTKSRGSFCFLSISLDFEAKRFVIVDVWIHVIVN